MVSNGSPTRLKLSKSFCESYQIYCFTIYAGPAPPECNLPQLKKRKLRTTFRKEQVEYMEKYFKISMYLNILDRKELAVQLGLEETQVLQNFNYRVTI